MASGLKVTPIGDQWAFRNLFDIARNRYVAARVSLSNGMLENGCLLAQQSIEGYLKAIAHARNQVKPELYYFEKKKDSSKTGKTQIWGHDLNALVQALLPDNPRLSALTSPQMHNFLNQLTDSYTSMRHGKATSGAVYATMIQQLDESAKTLEIIYHIKRNLKNETKLYVPKNLQQTFLHDNKFFDKSKITSFSMVGLVPGLDISDLEAKLNFDNAKVVQSAGAMLDNRKKKSK